MKTASSCDRAFVVLNPGGRDAEQSFVNGPGLPTDAGHPPVNYHAFAACMHGSFLRDAATVPPEATVLLLLRRDLRPALRTLDLLKKKGARVFITWKESGLHQVAKALDGRNQWERFQELSGNSFGAIATTHELPSLYRAAGARNVHFLPTPYPVDFPQWNFSRPVGERAGIFIGTREFDVPTRFHEMAIQVALSLAGREGECITVIDNGSCARWKKKSFASHPVRFVKGPLPYHEYLRLIASHRAVFQLDRSAVPGQVAGDCLLAGVLCIGGDGAVDREAFVETCGFGRDLGGLSQLMERAIQDPAWLEHTGAIIRNRALEKLSFAAIAAQLHSLFPLPNFP
jgi:hypothetical protein